MGVDDGTGWGMARGGGGTLMWVVRGWGVGRDGGWGMLTIAATSLQLRIYCGGRARNRMSVATEISWANLVPCPLFPHVLLKAPVLRDSVRSVYIMLYYVCLICITT